MADGMETPRLHAPVGDTEASRSGRPRSAPDEVWAAVRADYLGGLSAPAVCRRHRVGLTAMRNRAAREGWRRADAPWISPNDRDPDDEGLVLEETHRLDDIEARQLSYVAHRRMMRAVLHGDAAGAMRWRKVRDAMMADQIEEERFAAHEAEMDFQLGRAEADDVDDVDDADDADGNSARPNDPCPEPAAKV